jgi:hypothetical protein
MGRVADDDPFLLTLKVSDNLLEDINQNPP